MYIDCTRLMENDHVTVLSLTTTSEMMLMSDYCQGDELNDDPDDDA